MHEHSEPDRVHALLLSTQPTFETAASKHIAGYPKAFLESWRAWLDSKE